MKRWYKNFFISYTLGGVVGVTMAIAVSKEEILLAVVAGLIFVAALFKNLEA